MKKEILKDYGWCQVIKDESNYYLKFDKGGIVITMITYKISEAEAKISIDDETKAEKIAKSILTDKSKEEVGSI